MTALSRTLTSLLCFAAFGIAALPAFAGGTQPRTTSTSVEGVMYGDVCRIGYHTYGADMIPPDFTFPGNPAAASISFVKNCTGAVIGEFTAETVIAPAGGIHFEFYATCISTWGYAGACTPGQKFTGSPGTIYLSDNTTNLRETHGMTLVIPALKPGKWRFDVVPIGDGASKLGYRTLIVTAYKGG